MKGLTLLLALLVSFGLVLAGCAGGGDDDTGDDDIDEPEASEDCGPDGCEVIVDDPDSPLHGFKLEIPEGALDEETTIKVYYEGSLPTIPAVASSVGPACRIEPQELIYNKLVT
ncbi:MAG TPA: hypothetical protein ENF73_06560, partial [Proteobacteria bacterium]|nr:hypothetical protein [Pseudomonadota bacterium]